MLRILVGDPRSRVEINSLKLLVATLIIHTIGPQTILLLPGFVQGLVEYAGFSDQEAGFIASMELIGMTCATIAMMFLVARVNWRYVFALSLLLIIFGNIASIFVSDIRVFCALRFATGVGGGDGYHAVLILGIVSLAVSLALILPAVIARARLS